MKKKSLLSVSPTVSSRVFPFISRRDVLLSVFVYVFSPSNKFIVKLSVINYLLPRRPSKILIFLLDSKNCLSMCWFHSPKNESLFINWRTYPSNSPTFFSNFSFSSLFFSASIYVSWTFFSNYSFSFPTSSALFFSSSKSLFKISYDFLIISMS